jgi:hypothetical protein
MVDDLDAMRERDRTARIQKTYNHPSTAKAREQDAGPKASPQSAMATRHADEIAEQRARHHGESQKLYQKHNQTRAAKLQTSHALDGNLDRDHGRQRDETHERHARERSAMQRRHLTERDRLRSKRS